MSGHELVEAELRDGFHFRGGHRALDLVATLTGRLKPLQRDLLAETGNLARWLAAAGMAESRPAPSPADLDRARALREAIHGIAQARIGGREAAPSDVATLNAIASGQPAVPRLDAHGRARLEGDAAAQLATLAREAVLLLGGSDAARIRRCEGEGCAMLFLDTSRGGDRRWCSMKRCGNKAKVAEFRRRRAARSGPAD